MSSLFLARKFLRLYDFEFVIFRHFCHPSERRLTLFRFESKCPTRWLFKQEMLHPNTVVYSIASLPVAMEGRNPGRGEARQSPTFRASLTLAASQSDRSNLGSEISQLRFGASVRITPENSVVLQRSWRFKPTSSNRSNRRFSPLLCRRRAFGIALPAASCHVTCHRANRRTLNLTRWSLKKPLRPRQSTMDPIGRRHHLQRLNLASWRFLGSLPCSR